MMSPLTCKPFTVFVEAYALCCCKSTGILSAMAWKCQPVLFGPAEQIERMLHDDELCTSAP